MCVISEAPAPDVVDVLVATLRHAGARRVLEIGTGPGDSALAIAAALPAEGMLLTLERDAQVAGEARHRLAAAGVAAKVSVLIGDASRYLHKIAGPFDLIFQNGDPAQCDASLERLIALLRPSGILVTNNSNHGADYNNRLAADPRLSSSFLTIGNGVTISVKHAASGELSQRRGFCPENAT